MKDKRGTQIFKGDVVTVFISKSYDSLDPKNLSLSYTFTGVVRKVNTFRTGYCVGGSIEVVMPPINSVLPFSETIRESRYVTRLTNEQAMLWKLENE
jgi:hypothetical protein